MTKTEWESCFRIQVRFLLLRIVEQLAIGHSGSACFGSVFAVILKKWEGHFSKLLTTYPSKGRKSNNIIPVHFSLIFKYNLSPNKYLLCLRNKKCISIEAYDTYIYQQEFVRIRFIDQKCLPTSIFYSCLFLKFVYFRAFLHIFLKFTKKM